MKKLFLLLARPVFFGASCCLCLATAFAQAPTIQWQNNIGGSGIEQVYCIQRTQDLGYVIGGHSSSNISGDKSENCLGGYDYWIVKLDSTGNIQWQNTIGGNDAEDMRCIRQTTDGGYILGGSSLSNISGDKTENSIGSYDYWVVKLNSSGNIQWQNTIGGGGTDRLYAALQTFDGGYIIGGYSGSGISGDKTENSNGSYDYWVLKLDTIGNIIWQNTIGGNQIENLQSIYQATDGGYILGGSSNSNISGDKSENSLGLSDYWIVKLDSLGNIQWQNTIGGSDDDSFRSIEQTADGGYFLGGFSRSNSSVDKTENCFGNWDYWVVKTDSSGNIVWDNTIGGSDIDNLYSIQQTFDGSYLLTGESVSNISGEKTENSNGDYDYWIIKLNASGNNLWQNTIGGNSFDYGYFGQQTVDGGYIVVGFSGSNISGDKTENSQGGSDYWVIKLAPDSITGIIHHQNQYQISIYPNPAEEYFELRIADFELNNKYTLTITDLLGNLIFESEIRNPESEILTSFLTPGMYIIKVYSDKGVFQQKLIVN